MLTVILKIQSSRSFPSPASLSSHLGYSAAECQPSERRVLSFQLVTVWINSPPRRSFTMSVNHSFCLSYCQQDYCKSNQSIFFKLGIMIGPINLKNRLTFGGDAVPDTDSGSLFHFPHHCGIGDFERFINILHTVTGRFSRHSAK